MVSETVNGLMAIPNLIALALLSPELAHLTIEFKGKKTAPHV
jgi:Na+/alanine symporter